MIKNLTDSNSLMLPVYGYLHKGGEKKGKIPGIPLGYFRLKPLSPNDKDLINKFHLVFGQQPQSVNFYLPYANLESNWETYREQVIEGVGLKHRCDGEYCTVLYNERNGKLENVTQTRIKCPGGCQPTGRLAMFIPELERIGIIKFTTKSIRDITEISGILNFLFQRFQNNCQHIPLVLKIFPIKVSISFFDKNEQIHKKKILERFHVRIEIVQTSSYEKELGNGSMELERLTLPDGGREGPPASAVG